MVKLEQYFAKTPLKDGREFSHYRPARYLAEHVDRLESSISAQTLDRFERAFETLNALL